MYTRAVVPQQHCSISLSLTGFLVSSRCASPTFPSVVTVEKKLGLWLTEHTLSSLSLQQARETQLSEERRINVCKPTKKMDSPLLEQRPCPLCPGAIAGASALNAWGPTTRRPTWARLRSAAPAVLIPRLSRYQRLAQFEDCYVSPVEDQELDVVEMEDHEEGVPFVFAIPADRAGPDE